MKRILILFSLFQHLDPRYNDNVNGFNDTSHNIITNEYSPFRGIR